MFKVVCDVRQSSLASTMAGVRLSTQTMHGVVEGSELGTSECSTDGNVDKDGNLEILGAWLG